MPTREAYGVVGLALLIFLVAYNLQAGWVYAVDALLVGVLVAGVLSARLSVRGISLSRLMAPDAVEGEAMSVALILRARGVGPRFFVEVRDAVPGLEPAVVLAPVLWPGRAVSITYPTVAVRRGVHRVKDATVHSHGLSGLFLARRTQPASGQITVYPRFWKIARLPLLGTSLVPESLGSARRRGGLEFHGLRDYRPGDSLRHIHWRSSARRGAPVVQEFEQENPGTITLLLDSRAGVQEGIGSESTFEDLVRAAASIAWYVTTRGGIVRILTARGSAVIDATGGWRPTLSTLAEIAPDGTLAPGELLATTLVGRAAQVILLTPESKAITQLARQGQASSGVLADVTSYAIPRGQVHREGSGSLTIPVCVIRRGENIGAALEGL